MDKKKKEIILIVCLIPVLALVLLNSLRTVAEKKKKSGSPKTTTTQKAPPIPEAAMISGGNTGDGELPPPDEKLIQMQNTIADGEWGRDPFNPPPVKEEDRVPSDWKDFKLTGVIPGRAATINGEIIGVGEKFEGYILIKIENYQITLEKAGESFILTLPEE